MRQLGGETLLLSGNDMQLGRGETIADTAQVLSRYVDAIMIRATDHDHLLELAEHATVPVINGLTDRSHPCQIMADIMTFEEHRGPICGKTVAWVGDGNNVLHSLIEASARFGFRLNMAVPPGSAPDDRIVDWARNNGGNIMLTHDAGRGGTRRRLRRHRYLGVDGPGAPRARPQCSPALSGQCRADEARRPDALFMHCLPAHRGEEVTAEVIDGPQSVVFDEAENRLHAQKSVLAWCLGAI